MTDATTQQVEPPIAMQKWQPPALAAPPRGEFQDAQRMATMLAKTNMVPAAYRQKPDDILAAWAYGRELGFALIQSVNNLDVVDGRPALRAAAMVALVQRAGHSIEILEASDLKATVRGTRRDTGKSFSFTWTMDMARRASLAGKANWKNYPEAMLISRATSQVCRTFFPDVLRGMIYSAEELIDMVELPAPSGAGTVVPPASNDAEEAKAQQLPADPLLTPDERDQMKRWFGDPVDPADLRKGWAPGTLEGLKAALDVATTRGCAPVGKLSELRRSHYQAVQQVLADQEAAKGDTSPSEAIDDEGQLT